MNWAVDGCLGWYHHEYMSGVVRCVPAYWRYGREFSKSNPARRAGFIARTIEKVVEELERARQRLVIRY